MKNELAVYRPGELHLITTIIGDKVAWSDRTKDEYLADLDPGYIVVPLDDAIKLIEKAEDNLCGEWKEITGKQWHEMLNVLPPQKWEHCAGVEIFRMCEYWTSNITAHYAMIRDKGLNERFFTAMRRNTESYGKIAVEIAALVNR